MSSQGVDWAAAFGCVHAPTPAPAEEGYPPAFGSAFAPAGVDGADAAEAGSRAAFGAAGPAAQSALQPAMGLAASADIGGGPSPLVTPAPARRVSFTGVPLSGASSEASTTGRPAAPPSGSIAAVDDGKSVVATPAFSAFRAPLSERAAGSAGAKGIAAPSGTVYTPSPGFAPPSRVAAAPLASKPAGASIALPQQQLAGKVLPDGAGARDAAQPGGATGGAADGQAASTGGEGDGRGPEVPAAEPPAAAEQEEPEMQPSAYQIKEAAAKAKCAELLGMLPAQHVLGSAQGRLPVGPAERRERQIDMIHGNSSGGLSRVDSAVKFVRAFSAFVAAKAPAGEAGAFPIEESDVQAFDSHLAEGGRTATMRRELPQNLRFLSVLMPKGGQVPDPDSVAALLAKPVRKPPRAAEDEGGPHPKAQEAPPPKVCIDVERASIYGIFGDGGRAQLPAEGWQDDYSLEPQPAWSGEPGGLTPAQWYATLDWVSLAHGERGEQLWLSKGIDPLEDMPGTFSYKVALDGKSHRIDVRRDLPDLGFEAARHPNVRQQFQQLRRLDGTYNNLMPEFQWAVAESKKPWRTDRWAADSSMALAPVKPAATAKAAICEQRAYSCGLPGDQPTRKAVLEARHMGGNHAGRHVGSTVAKLLSWPAQEIDPLTDKAPETAGSASSSSSSSRPSRRTSASTPRYHVAATTRLMMHTRVRVMKAARAFIEHAGGYEQLSYDTSWQDIIPHTCPSVALREYYGPSWDFDEAGPFLEAAAPAPAAPAAAAPAAAVRTSKRKSGC